MLPLPPWLGEMAGEARSGLKRWHGRFHHFDTIGEMAGEARSGLKRDVVAVAYSLTK